MKVISIRYLRGVGPGREVIFNRAGVLSVRDLLHYFPFRYQDRRQIKKINQLKINDFSLVQGKVKSVYLKKIPYFVKGRRVRSIFEIILEDDSGALRCVWFNQAYLAESIKVGSELMIYGKLYLSKKGPQIVSPEYELSQTPDSLGQGKIVGVYSLPSELNQKFMRKTISLTLKSYRRECQDPLPFRIRKEINLPNIVESLEEIHFPNSWQSCQRARERFIFEELFLAQVLVYCRKAKHRLQTGPTFRLKTADVEAIRKALVFKLTLSQEKVLGEILDDLSASYPMHRILQGDVGCGKTVIAAFSLGVCLASGWQGALMVPTEVLAYQHKETLSRILKNKSIKVVTSSLSKKEKESIYNDLGKGKIKLIIGTHSLIQEEVKFKKLGLVVIDEQHKFGVAQRALLPKKGKIPPHCLVMSATPIPRSLALSLYGDLDLSIIKHMPQGRILAKTILLKPGQRSRAYAQLKAKLEQKRQAYIVYPLIEESENEQLQSLEAMHKKIAAKFSQYSVGIFHGKMKPQEKIEVIKQFKDKKIDILVSTTVVEVGLDIKNATLMIVENPERFGLAQLHQLRGRIQRSTDQSQFILILPKNLSQKSLERLKIIAKESCGFKIAEEDLKIRGPGDFFGQLQHGLPDLKIANPLKDLEVLKTARKLAYRVIKADPDLVKRENSCIKNHLFYEDLKRNS